MINGTAPAVMPEQCRAPGALAPSLAHEWTSTTLEQRTGNSLIGTPVRAIFTVGGPEYTAHAFTCIGDGNTPLLNSFSLMAAVLKSPRIRPPHTRCRCAGC